MVGCKFSSESPPKKTAFRLAGVRVVATRLHESFSVSKSLGPRPSETLKPDAPELRNPPKYLSEYLAGCGFRYDDSGHQRPLLLARVRDLAAEQRKSERQSLRELRAVAEASLQHQRLVLDRVVSYITLKRAASEVRPLLLLHRIKHDETQMTVRAGYSAHSENDDPELLEHRARIFVVQEEWGIVCSETKKATATDLSCFLLQGASSAKVITAILDKTCIVPSAAYGLCDNTWVLLESDECSANARAAKMAEAKAPEAPVLHLFCSGHKLHQIAKTTWDHFPFLHKGLTQVLKVMKSPGMFQKFSDTMVDLVLRGDLLRVCAKAPLDPEEEKYRETIFTMFTPNKADKPRAFARISAVCSHLLNSDWRKEGPLEHRCHPQCCRSIEHSRQKLVAHLPRFLKALRLQRLEVSNWSQWPEQVCLVGFLMHVHSVFRQVFQKAFPAPLRGALSAAREAGLEEPQDGARDREAEALYVAKMLDASWTWLQKHDAAAHLYIVRVSLDVEVEMMRLLLKQTSADWDIEAMMNSSGSPHANPRNKEHPEPKLLLKLCFLAMETQGIVRNQTPKRRLESDKKGSFLNLCLSRPLSEAFLR